MKKALEQIRREDELIQQWRREWGELTNGINYETWLESKLLTAQDEIAQWQRDYACNEKERSHLANTVVQEERSLSNQRLAKANRLQLMVDQLKNVKISGTMRGPDWLDDLAIQAGKTATECDSAFHEAVAITLRRAAIELRRYQVTVNAITKELRQLEAGEC
jgi:glucan phosphorylase